MFIKKWLVAVLLMLALPSVTAYAATDSQSSSSDTQGIEITVNVNTASAEELSTLLKGVGITKAEAIVEYRKQHGAFVSKDDLTKVKGIGSSIVEKNESRILL